MSITPVPTGLSEAIDQMPLLSMFLPYKFGYSALEGLVVNCATCGTELSSDSIRGEIDTIGEGKTASLKAFALCFECKTITPIEAKFHDNGSALYKCSNGWIKGKWDARPVGFIVKASIFLRNNWQQITPPAIALVIVMGWFLRR